MCFARSLSAIMLISATVTVSQPQLVMALTPVEVKAISKEFTVLIGGDGLGSGVIFERKGGTYFVLTNHHVVSQDGRYEIQTPDGDRYPVYRSQEIPGVDLAVLQFTSKKNYRTASLGNSDQVREKMTIYAAGWSADVLPIINERSYGFTVGSILRREQRPDRGYALVYDNEAIPGMSGGPMLDENGRVVGINGRAIQEPNSKTIVRMGIPINIFLAARNNRRLAVASTTTRQLTAEDFISFGGAKANRKDFQGAIANYNQAIQINPNNLDAYFQRGLAYSKLKNYQAALRDFNQGLQLSPKNVNAYTYRAFVNLQLKDYESAFADSNQALRLDPNHGVGYAIRGTTRLATGDKKGALADIDRAVQRYPNSGGVYDLRSYARSALGDKSGAIADLHRAASLYQKERKTDSYQRVLNRMRKLQETRSPSK